MGLIGAVMISGGEGRGEKMVVFEGRFIFGEIPISSML